MLLQLPVELVNRVVAHLSYNDQNNLMVSHTRFKKIIHLFRFSKHVKIVLAIQNEWTEYVLGKISKVKQSPGSTSSVEFGLERLEIIGILRFVKFLMLLGTELKSHIRSIEICLVSFDDHWPQFSNGFLLFSGARRVMIRRTHRGLTRSQKDTLVGFLQKRDFGISLLPSVYKYGIDFKELNKNILELIDQFYFFKIGLKLIKINKDGILFQQSLSNVESLRLLKCYTGAVQTHANLISG